MICCDVPKRLNTRKSKLVGVGEGRGRRGWRGGGEGGGVACGIAHINGKWIQFIYLFLLELQ